MNKLRSALKIVIITMIVAITMGVLAYPIDGYYSTGIRRLLYLQMILDGEISGTKPIKGAQKSINDIKLNLTGQRSDSLSNLPNPDPEFQKKINALFPNLHDSYSIAVLDISPGRKIRYAKRHDEKNYMPGSVGKLAILVGLFTELQRLYPDSGEMRMELMKTTIVRAGKWGLYDEHTVPFFNPETKKFFKRVVQEQDTFSLYEWTDHMVSVSNNGAASIVWREAMLMRVFGEAYPVPEQVSNEYFKNTPKAELSRIAVSVVNDPLRTIGINDDEWRLGSMFTSGAKQIIPGSGGSTASPLALMKFLVAMERGRIVDEPSSLEIKRFMYATDRRIRYAASDALKNAAVYFKSGSLYKCKKEEGYECKKYMGNVDNYMNSVILVEHADTIVYMVTLMSNVLKKNSANDHFALASQIDRIIRTQ